MILAAAAVLSASALAAQEVRIGAAHFPPYVSKPEEGGNIGLLPQMVDALNNLQQEYHFVIVPTSLPRRFRDFQQGRVDMAIFENPDWGWQDIPHVSVDLGLEDAEVFVAHRSEGREQSYFRNLDGKRLALFSGYHYAFAGFNADPRYLLQRFNATLTYSHDSNLTLILRDRADIALITRSYLSDFMARNPDTAEQFLVSERVDQVYHHYALLRPNGPISGEEFNRYLRRLHDSGELTRIFQPYRIAVVPLAASESLARNGQAGR
ncbi:transporter substrate-binding domain-containing protein [Pseudomonas sp. HR96]|nr:transporter substrate-binding domain-containing protein [Pseudomonas sp. HR96]WPP02187.1 transporter substrate-binding domain-containing protein [Pseudomonas sp. HR96]